MRLPPSTLMVYLNKKKKKTGFRDVSKPPAVVAYLPLISLQSRLHRWVYHQLQRAEQGPEPVHSVWGESSSPAQVAQALHPGVLSLWFPSCFPPSLLSSSLRYLTLGRNVRRRNMSTRELWVLPRALSLPGSFCLYPHWHSMTWQMLRVWESCWHRLLGYGNVGYKVAPFKFLLCFVFNFFFLSPKESVLKFTLLQILGENLSYISQFNIFLEIQMFLTASAFCPFRNWTGWDRGWNQVRLSLFLP